MKEFIQKSADEVAIVIYDSPLPPKYFRLTKRFIKTLFVLVPLTLCALLFFLFLWGLGVRLQNTPAPALPEVMSESESKMAALESELEILKSEQKALTDKIAAGLPSAAITDDLNLMLIKRPYGMQNLMTQNKVTLDQVEFIDSTEKVGLKFQIINSTQDQRVSGHIVVFMISETGLLAWPSELNVTLSQGIKYSSGDSFAVSRLRPTYATFTKSMASEKVKFVLYIFNREGDLLLVKETESFKTGPKS